MAAPCSHSPTPVHGHRVRGTRFFPPACKYRTLGPSSFDGRAEPFLALHRRRKSFWHCLFLLVGNNSFEKREYSVPRWALERYAILSIDKSIMIFSREYVGYLAKKTVKHLVEAKMIRTDKVHLVEERVANALVDELSLEDRINEEVRVILEAYQDEMRRTGAQYAEMFKKVKMELARKYKAVL
jgi:Protein of unknown function (DUF507)